MPAEVRDSNESASNREDLSRVDPIDFLFTVVLAIGLTPEILGGNFSGLLSEAWVQNGTLPTTPNEAERFLAFVAGLLALSLSWFGYNRSDTKAHQSLGKLYGLFRFELQILMVIAYGWMLLNYSRTGVVIVSLVLVFGAYILWDWVAIREEIHNDPSLIAQYPRASAQLRYISIGRGIFTPPFWRQFVTLFWTGMMIAIALLLLAMPSWTVLYGASWALVLDRVNKERRWPWQTSLLRRLAPAEHAAS